MTDHPWKGVARVMWSFLEFYDPLNFSGMAEDKIVKFCARIGQRSVCLAMANFPPDGRGQSKTKPKQSKEVFTKAQWCLNFFGK